MQQLFTISRLRQVVLAATLWAAGSAVVPCGAQCTEPFNFSADIAPSVESFKMTQYGGLSPSLYTGAMTYSLPLYTYQDEDFTIPITLEYSYDGYKPAVHSGTVGLGWLLNCGGVITREVRGYPDESDGVDNNILGYFHTANEVFHTAYEWGVYNSKNRFAYNQTPLFLGTAEEDIFTDSPVYATRNTILYGTNDRRYDPSPDIFHFSMPGCKGDFMCDEEGVLKVFNTENAGTVSVEYDDNPMEHPGFIITTGDGYAFYFGGKSNGLEYTYGDPDPAYPRTPVAWHLYKMVAPNGRTVEYIFESDYESELDIPIYRKAMIECHTANYENGGMADLDSHPIVSCRRYPLLKVIRIDGKDLVRFGYDTRDKDESASECFIRSNEVEPSFFSCWISNSRRHLKSMTAYDNTGQQIQTAHFEKLFTDQTNENSSRMFLTRVRSSRDGEHRFAYKDITEQTLFPANNTESVDHWGYWTSVRCDSLIRHINVNPSVSLYRQLDTATFKQAQFMPTSRGALCSITYPTGGSSLIDYELNSVSRMLDRSSSQYPHLIANTLNWQAGGVRVCRIVNISGERRDTVRYEYNNPGTSQSSGILMKMPRYGTTVQNTHLTSESGFMVLLNVTQIGFSDLSSCGQPRDPHIGYGYVRECRPDGSSVLYHFNDYSAFPDYYPGTDRAQFLDRTKTGPYDAVGCWGVGPTEQGIAQLLLPPYMDYMNMRGMLASKTEYDAQNVPRGRTIYHYYSINDFSAESVFSGLIWFVKMRQTFKCPILTSVTERKYENGDSLSTLTTFAYDTLGRKIQESVINNAGEHRKQYLYYSNTMTTCPSQLRRALAAVALTRTDAGGTRLLQTERYTYNSLSGNPLPTKIDTYASDAPQPASSFTSLFEAPAGYKHRTVDLTYDGIFHRLVRADLPGGAYISYTWDAAGKHILAKTVGDTPNTWSYSWKDGVGLSEVTDPTGQSLEYYYDACSRLGLVRDGLSRNIESYQYHFTNE